MLVHCRADRVARYTTFVNNWPQPSLHGIRHESSTEGLFPRSSTEGFPLFSNGSRESIFARRKLTTLTVRATEKDRSGRNFIGEDAENDGNKLTTTESASDLDKEELFPGWNVPWGWEITAFTLVAWIGTFVFTGVVTSLVVAKFGTQLRGDLSDLDFKALVLLINQLAQMGAGLLLLWSILGKYQPLPSDLFRIDLRRPFAWPDGWLMWALLGIPVAVSAVQFAAVAADFVNGNPSTPTREDADALVQVLPIIAASPFSTISLVIVTGVCAPLLEETVFRGFLLTSLTNYVPTPVATGLSAVAFAAAHLTPGEFFQLTALGIVLGLSYSRTKNLLTPMLIHSFWNSGIIIVLTLLRLEGYDLSELI